MNPLSFPFIKTNQTQTKNRLKAANKISHVYYNFILNECRSVIFNANFSKTFCYESMGKKEYTITDFTFNIQNLQDVTDSKTS